MQFVAIDRDSESEDDSDVVPANASRAPPKPHLKVAKRERGQKAAVLDTKPKSKPRSGNVKVSKLAPAPAIPGPATSNVNNLPEFAIST